MILAITMIPTTATRLTPFLITILALIFNVQCLDYEIVEEEPASLNSIERANAGFVCQSEGYFADVSFGCQFYHICENANNPYDKPSFVKHTFSCVNGTVFNQMSFTCTRYDDSIPCEASPNYFYLNKRNGDPKAYFLTEEDIFKPAQSSRHSLTSNDNGALAAGGGGVVGDNNGDIVDGGGGAGGISTTSLFNNEPESYSLQRSMAHNKEENNYINNNNNNDNKLRTFGESPYNNNNNKDDTGMGGAQDGSNLERRNRLISSVINNYDPVDDNINMDEVYGANGHSRSVNQPLQQHHHLQNHLHHERQQPQSPQPPSPPSQQQQQQQSTIQARAPYEMNPKMGQIFPSTVQSILKHPNTGSANKYEPANKVSTYVPMNSHYEDKVAKDYPNDEEEKLIFGSLRDNYLAKSLKTDHVEMTPRSINQIQPLKNTYAPYSDMMDTSSPTTPVEPSSPTPAPHRKTTFTPQTFSRLYIENQKASKYQLPSPPETSPPTRISSPLSSIDSRFAPFRSQQGRNLSPPPSLSSTITNYPEPNAVPMTKYDQYNEERFPHLDPSPQQYVPSPIRILQPLTLNQDNNDGNHNEIGVQRSLLVNNNNHNHNNNHLLNNHEKSGHIMDVRGATTGQQNIRHQEPRISFMNENSNNPIIHQQHQHHSNPHPHHPHHHHQHHSHQPVAQHHHGNVGNNMIAHNNLNNKNNNANHQQQAGQFLDYGTDYKVVKQVKGKNLLIDPSLENDPARDNIIAQVLEMLSKYN